MYVLSFECEQVELLAQFYREAPCGLCIRQVVSNIRGPLGTCFPPIASPLLEVSFSLKTTSTNQAQRTSTSNSQNNPNCPVLPPPLKLQTSANPTSTLGWHSNSLPNPFTSLRIISVKQMIFFNIKCHRASKSHRRDSDVKFPWHLSSDRTHHR